MNFFLSVPDPNFAKLLPLGLNLFDGQTQGRDSKIWRWDNKSFFVKSFYSSLNDDGLCCTFGKTLWKGHCPLKVKAFFWLAIHNKILSHDILPKQCCNHISPTPAPSIMLQAKTFSTSFSVCPFSIRRWSHFEVVSCTFLPSSLWATWTAWGMNETIHPNPLGLFLTRAICWSIWV